MLWIGNRTRDLDSAHIEYCRGIENPVGVKIDANIADDALSELVRQLNPQRQHGKLVLITRLGSDNVRKCLPDYVKAVERTGIPVLWTCDPMHGNTVKTETGVKTRSFDHIIRELSHTYEVHREAGGHLAGVHFELTGENVTECTGGAVELQDIDLDKNYQTYCDPRLNYSQGLEVAFLIAKLFKSYAR
jgi:3-deoxy-7-phosphoheptulonate synthase